MKRATIGGRELWVLNATDAALLHEQIFVRETYGGHGIGLRDGDVVIDAGANIGLASLWFASRKAVKLYAIEPNPRVFAALRRNVPAHVTCLECALAERAGRGELTWDPFVSSTGSLEAPPELDRGAVAADLGVPRVVAAGIGLLRRLARRRDACELRTLSDIIAEHRLERVDLLKLDVEGAEARALAGLVDSDWPKVRQLIVETADADGIGATLRARGFTVEVDREPGATYRALGLRNLYARRVTS